MVWKLRATIGHGWLREHYGRAPIITADHREAAQYATRAAVEADLALLTPTPVALEPIEVEDGP
ncbi:MAG TPA: hypothetical protein PLV68_15215, partial [Ilumatobacteraceae bacterium]|nr:hypothetical protein [Ilumatobacteraceae bacterium]